MLEQARIPAGVLGAVFAGALLLSGFLLLFQGLALGICHGGALGGGCDYQGWETAGIVQIVIGVAAAGGSMVIFTAPRFTLGAGALLLVLGVLTFALAVFSAYYAPVFFPLGIAAGIVTIAVGLKSRHPMADRTNTTTQ